LAAFQVTLIGRFWVIPEARGLLGYFFTPAVQFVATVSGEADVRKPKSVVL